MKAFLDSQWFPDIAILLVILIFAFSKGRKGLFKCIIPVVILVVALVGSYILTPYVEPMAQEKLLPFIEKKVAEKLDGVELGTIGDLSKLVGSKSDAGTTSKAEGQSGTTDKSASDSGKSGTTDKSDASEKAINGLSTEDNQLAETIINALPENIKELVQKYGVDVTSTIKDKISDIKIGTDLKAQLSTSAVALVSSAATKAIHTGCYVVVALALLLVLNIIKALINPLIQKTPVVGSVNRTLGFVFGLVEGILVVYLAITVMKLFNIGNIVARADSTVLLRLLLSVDPKGIVALVTKK